MKLLFSFLLIICISCTHTYTYYVVRHAERADGGMNTMGNDPPLSEAGLQRAEKLKEVLKNKNIGAIYSTNTIRTKSTVQPAADYFKLPVTIYGPQPDSVFIASVKALKKNVLIVGHSNTVDDIVNMLCGEKKVSSDLKEAEYNRLFVVKIKGEKTGFEEKTIYPGN